MNIMNLNKIEECSMFSFSEFLNLSTKKHPSIYYSILSIQYNTTNLKQKHYTTETELPDFNITERAILKENW